MPWKGGEGEEEIGGKVNGRRKRKRGEREREEKGRLKCS